MWTQRFQETYRLLVKSKTFLTPTLVAEHALTLIGDLNRTQDPKMAYVSAEKLKWWKPENGLLTKYRTPEYIGFRKGVCEVFGGDPPRRSGGRAIPGWDRHYDPLYLPRIQFARASLICSGWPYAYASARTATSNPADC